jgi:hypothetical protein
VNLDPKTCAAIVAAADSAIADPRVADGERALLGELRRAAEALAAHHLLPASPGVKDPDLSFEEQFRSMTGEGGKVYAEGSSGP